MQHKHAPERTCVACRQMKPKRELLRAVRTPEGHVEIDPGGRKPGRGAYLCTSPKCWQAGLQSKLEHALRTRMTPENRTQLDMEIKERLGGND